MASSFWTATIEDKDKKVLAFASTLRAVTLNRGLNRPAEVDATMDIEGLDTKALLDQYASKAVYLRLAENGTTRFFGVLTDVQLQLDDQSNVSVRFADLAVQYATSYQFRTATGSVYVPKVHSSSHNTIIDDVLNTTDVLLPLTRSGSVTATRSLDTQGLSRLETIDALASLYAGIDWFVTPDQTLKIGSGNSIGSDKSASVRFQFGGSGQANVQSATVQYLPPRNRIWFSGNNETLTLPRSGDATSHSNYGIIASVVQQLDAGTESETDVADGQERKFPRRVVDFSLEPSTCPRPWTDFDLGDGVGFDLVTPATTITGRQYVTGITVSLDEQLVESEIVVSAEVT